MVMDASRKLWTLSQPWLRHAASLRSNIANNLNEHHGDD
jgi:hypothetical protein